MCFIGVFCVAESCTMPVHAYGLTHDYLADTIFRGAVVEWLP